ncbi:MAG TPA: FAD-dependent oxidoreductase [Streptosporangiaceae bacterium]|jgi:hypothetical protein
MSDAVDVAIVGAGPYGLSLAAHLRAAGISFRIFGQPMHLWAGKMPAGMFLKSQGFASNISDPGHTHTLREFCRLTRRPYFDYGLPVALDTFIKYGQWFRSELVPGLEEVLVTGIARGSGGFELTLANGDQVPARRVVVAAGVDHFAYVPEPLAALPPDVCTHTSEHTDLGIFSGQQVAVVGAGQSALETAALLHEGGAQVVLVSRKPALAWNGTPLALDRPLIQRLKEPEAGLGSGWATWFYSNRPELFRLLPRGTRVERARTALGPAGASWLRPRFEGKIPALTGQAVAGAQLDDGRVRLSLSGAGGHSQELSVHHVLAGTGYRTDLARLSFLGDGMRAELQTVGGTGSPRVGRDYQSSVAGLYFIGPAVAPTFGPVMRFVFGSEHAAVTTARALRATTRAADPVLAGAVR